VINLTETVKEFKEKWNKKFEEIKKQSLNKSDCYEIFEILKLDIGYFYFLNKEKENLGVRDTLSLLTDLKMALNVAHSNYRRENKNMWSKIFGGPKTFNLFKL
jgi:hypothetical protein